MLAILATSGTRSGDVIALGLQVGTASLATLVTSVVYLLAVGRPSFQAWRSSAFTVAGFSFALGGMAVLLLPETQTSVEGVAVPLLFSAGGGVLAAAGVYAVRLACEGRPAYLAALTVGPNLLALACLLPTRVAFGEAPAVLPGVGWFAGCVVAFVVVMRTTHSTPQAPSDTEAYVEAPGNWRLHLIGNSGSALVGAILPIVYVSAMTSLDPGVAAVTFAITRIGTSIVSLGVNSILMVRVNWKNEVPQTGRLVTVAFALSAVLAGACLFFDSSGDVALGLLVVAWVIAIVATPFVTRVAHAQRLGTAFAVKFAAELLVQVPATFVLWSMPSSVGYFAVNLSISAIAVSVIGYFNRSHAQCLLGVLAVALSWACLFHGGAA